MTRLQVLMNFNDFQILDLFSLKIGLDLAHFLRAKSENFGGIPGKFNYLAGVPIMIRLQVLVNFNDFQNLSDFLSLKIRLDLAHLWPNLIIFFENRTRFGLLGPNLNILVAPLESVICSP